MTTVLVARPVCDKEVKPWSPSLTYEYITVALMLLLLPDLLLPGLGSRVGGVPGRMDLLNKRVKL